MPTSVALTPYFEAFIRQQIESGRYNNTSEVIRAGLSKSAQQVFSRLSQKYHSMAEGRQTE